MDTVYPDIIFLIAQQLDWESWTAFKQCSKQVHTICQMVTPEVRSEESLRAFHDKKFAFEVVRQRKYTGPMYGPDGTKDHIVNIMTIERDIITTIYDTELFTYVANEYVKYMKLPGKIVVHNSNRCYLDCKGMDVDLNDPKLVTWKNRIII